MLLCLMLVNAAAPYIFRSVCIPLFYEERQVDGIIEDKEKILKEYSYTIKHRDGDVKRNYAGFCVDGYWVRVPAKEYHQRNVGEEYTIYVYTSESGKEITHHTPFRIGKGLLMLLGALLVWAYWVWIFFFQGKKMHREQPQSKIEQHSRRKKNEEKVSVFSIILLVLSAVAVIYGLFYYFMIGFLLFDEFIF